jgi:drug/metabolite transporter (DMT)-like permease
MPGSMKTLLPLLLPLASALIYVVGALLIKRSNEFGVGIWRTTFVSNLTSALLFLLLLPLGGTVNLDLWWEPVIVAGLFVLGQVCNFLSLQLGDVSVATPVLGLKIILVALFSTLLLGHNVPLVLWIAAALSSAAIALLNLTGGRGHHHHVAVTILFAGLSAAMFALFDVLVQKWSPAWGAGRFLPLMMFAAALLSLGIVPKFPAPLAATPRGAWPWLLAGCLLFALQSLLFVTTIANFGNATGANVMYSSRGLWSVVVVWVVGHWFGNQERHLGASIFRTRLIGAALMMAAIVLVLLR